MPLTGGGGGAATYIPPHDTALTDMSTLTADVDIKSTPMTGWAWHNSANISTCTQNPSSNGYLQGVLSGDFKYWPNTWTAPRLYKLLPGANLDGLIFCRVRGDDVGDVAGHHEGIEMYFAQPYGVGVEEAHHYVGIAKNTANNHVVRGGYPGVQDQVTLADNAHPSDQIVAGIWLGMHITGGFVHYLYDTTDSTTPPHERSDGWTGFSRRKLWKTDQPEEGQVTAAIEVGFLFNSFAATGADATLEVMHFDDRALYPNEATDFGASNPAPCFGVT